MPTTRMIKLLTSSIVASSILLLALVRWPSPAHSTLHESHVRRNLATDETPNAAPTDAQNAPSKPEERAQKLQFVFLTGCDVKQHWQSNVLAHSFKRVAQEGSLTRIVSGCSPDEEQHVRNMTAELYPHVKLFFAKDYATQPYAHLPEDWYPPYNKPFGMHEWLQANIAPSPSDVVVFLDPDFVFIRPFVVNQGLQVARKNDKAVHEHHPVKPYLIYSGDRDIHEIHDQVRDGEPMAQIWTGLEDTQNGLGFPGNEAICEECEQVTKQDARKYYNVGPPYVMTYADWQQFAPVYCNMTVARRNTHRDQWIEEMHGYAFAAAKLGLKHTIVDNLASIGRLDVYMGFYDHLDANPCARDEPLPTSNEQPPLMHTTIPTATKDENGEEWFFYEHNLPDDLFTCDAWLLTQPPASVWDVAKQQEKEQGRQIALMNAYGVCMGIKSINAALLDYKERFCLHGYNSHKKLVLRRDGRPSQRLNVRPDDVRWQVIDEHFPSSDLFAAE